MRYLLLALLFALAACAAKPVANRSYDFWHCPDMRAC